MNIHQYDHAMVAFIDVIGWSNLIQESVSDSKLLFNMIELIESSSRSFFYPNGIQPQLHNGGLCISFFSDCLLISQSLTAGGKTDLFWRTLESITKHSLRDGFMYRGVVTSGLLYHQHAGVAVGPALSKAAEMESKEVKYPRIIIDDSAYLATPYEEGLWFFQSDDGYSCLDLLRFSPSAKFGMGEENIIINQKLHLEIIRPHVVTNLKKVSINKSANAYKYAVWFANYFNEVALEYGIDKITLD